MDQPQLPQDSGRTRSITQSQVINTQPIPQANYSKYQLPSDAINMELRRKLWEGLLPVKVDLSTSDLNSIEQPTSLYIMAPRENYFFYILSEVKWLFDSYAPADKVEAYDEMWFDFNNIPLKWNVPIGVQFDTYVGLKDKQRDLPWCLTFHYRGCPEEQVLRLEGLNFFKFHFINSLKESHNLRMGSAQEILSMQKKDETRMIEGILKHNYESFWEINQPLCDKSIFDLKKYAIRVFCNKHHTFVQPNIDVKRPISEDAHQQVKEQPTIVQDDPALYKLTIGEVLMQTFPRLFDTVLNDNGELEIQKMLGDKMEIIVQGVEVELGTPLYWMQLNMSYLDNFLYVSFNLK